MPLKQLKIHYANGVIEHVAVEAFKTHANGAVDLYPPCIIDYLKGVPVGPIHEGESAVVRIECNG